VPIPRRASIPEPAVADSIKPGTSWAIMQSFIEFSARGIGRLHQLPSFRQRSRAEPARNRQVLELLSANGVAPLPIIVGSWNPLDACFEPNQQRDDPSWPSPPSSLGCWQTDNEMGASYSLAFMAHHVVDVVPPDAGDGQATAHRRR
jgi:hypothetical protein